MTRSRPSARPGKWGADRDIPGWSLGEQNGV